MQQPELAVYRDPLDVLRRFVPTPLKAIYRIGERRVFVETNDFTLLPGLPLASEITKSQPPDLSWKLVRDPDVSALLTAPLLVQSDNLTVVEMGSACILALDQERGELVGFIGSAVDARTYQEYLLPYLTQMTSDSFACDEEPGEYRRSAESADA